MEMASYLAGEKWSDAPSCTHPLLATLARQVNDCTSDDGRQHLARLIPAVIGLTSDDPRVDGQIARRAAVAALPVADAEAQRVLAVAILTAEGVLAELDGETRGTGLERRLSASSRAALASVPDAQRWAYDMTGRYSGSVQNFRRTGAPSTVRCAVRGIAQACIPDPDERLRDLLEGAITDCAALVEHDRRPRADWNPDAWAAACRLTGVRV